ncbi:hypothetical protein TIFTF001_034086 [Ficus carica]|uniref:Uncharacterized protein n=1 Tax=Ficus carica TaxID=3494 RepID=A0AA88DZW6_FICCA|nr:hypothetical protein TIFTF001_034086 [Ficus carica]
MPEDPIPAVPLQEIPPQEAEADVEGNNEDPTDFMAAPEDQPEHPPDIKDFEDDPEEILFDDGDWDVDSDASSVITIELID